MVSIQVVEDHGQISCAGLWQKDEAVGSVIQKSTNQHRMQQKVTIAFSEQWTVSGPPVDVITNHVVGLFDCGCDV
jgi:hypothetical protein